MVNRPTKALNLIFLILSSIINIIMLEYNLNTIITIAINRLTLSCLKRLGKHAILIYMITRKLTTFKILIIIIAM